ncbi:hypothetical protein SLS53_008922 [Cytospora paraplurivora]|uniref:7-dehydrocholesterol reductase n=1 Tax=Cytospora paraplurivora TaxID=2898453 RepID=A0AAN9U4V1_9PEZI
MEIKRTPSFPKTHSSVQLSSLSTPHLKAKTTVTWGRAGADRTWLRSNAAALTILLLAPLLALSFHLALHHFHGSVSELLVAVSRGGFLSVFHSHAPSFSRKGMLAYTSWVVFQVALFVYLPGPVNNGQRTPAGNVLEYQTNGLLAWAVTHMLYLGLSCLGILDPAFIPRNWGGLVLACNVTGFALAGLAYAKAYLFPSHPGDSKTTDSMLYDFYMGVELNPRIGNRFDLKLFTVGRLGMIAWTLIDTSYIAYQYQALGRVEPSLALVTILHALYVVDFFINEEWYLKTIDIAHDHYGFYMAWGSCAWLPMIYTLPAQYTGLGYPASPSSNTYLALVFATGLAAYAVFRDVNNQRDRFRRSGGRCLIWGRPAGHIRARYTTSDGTEHHSLLLCSGWWGWSRHANYTADLVLSFCMCALAGAPGPLTWFYGLFMTGLLVHRCVRDEARCSAKYGSSWDDYRRRVPWRLVPGVI